MDRKLASVQRVIDLQPIPGADAILVASVLGWKCVVKKTEFKVLDRCVYFEIDSILPIAQWNDHLRKEPEKPLRVRTIRLRGQLSQGLALPMSLLPEGDYEIGQDVTETIGVKKYEPYIPTELIGKVKGTRPSWIPKTDEPRCLFGETIISTEDGNQSIEHIYDIGYLGRVKSFNEASGKIEYKKITNHLVSRNNGDWYEVEIDVSRKIICTGNHLIYMPDLLAYRRVDSIEIGNNVLIHTKN